MAKHQTLRDLVNARLNAAAEEIFALFESTIMEYEAELCRCVEENQRKQQRLDMVFNPSVVLHRAGAEVHVPSPSPPLPTNQKSTETAQIKEEMEEQSIKEEEEQPPLSISVKTEELPLIMQVQTVQREEEAHGEDVNSEPRVQPHTEPYSDTDNDENWESAAPMETDADGDHHSKVQEESTEESTAAPPPALSSVVMPKSAPRTRAAVKNGIVLETDKGAKKSNHVCSICQKRFRRERELERHIRVHTGERPYGCTICTKTFSQKIHLKVHMRTHSSEKPYSCTACSKTFNQKIHLEVHLRTHTGQRPYRCSVCKKTFTQKVYRDKHMSTHKENQ